MRNNIVTGLSLALILAMSASSLFAKELSSWEERVAVPYASFNCVLAEDKVYLTKSKGELEKIIKFKRQLRKTIQKIKDIKLKVKNKKKAKKKQLPYKQKKKEYLSKKRAAKTTDI